MLRAASEDGRTNEGRSIHTMEYDAAVKRKEVLTRATVWMNFDNIMLSEQSQTQKATYCMIPLI